MSTLAPIILFVYNRPEHTKRTIESLAKNTLADKSSLYIFSDGPQGEKDKPDVEAVRKYIYKISGFNKIGILEREKNLGLANSIINGVSEIFKRYDKVVVMEDDMISSPFFLKYINELLNRFENDQRIFSVTGYTFPIKIPEHYKHHLYLSPRSSSWGWGTWKSRWQKADWDLKDIGDLTNDKLRVENFNKGGDDLIGMLKNSIEGKIDSWSIKWTYSHFLNEAFCIYPVKSRIQNIGTDRSGVHTNKTKKFDVELELNDIDLTKINELQPDELLLQNFRKFFQKSIFNSLLQILKK